MPEYDPSDFRGRQPWQYGEAKGEAEIELDPDTAWWVERMVERGEVADGAFTTPYSRLDLLAGWVLRQEGRARPLSPPELVDEVAAGLDRVLERHEGEPTKPPRPKAQPETEQLERPAGPLAPERFGVLQALLAHLLARCGDETRATIPAQELVDRFHIPYDQLDDHLQLLNLVNFGGGCYAVYASLDGDEVRVDKELFGDAFRRPPRLTPLEARAIRLALEFVGPMIAAEAQTPLERVRKKLEETFGEFAMPEPTEPEAGSEEEQLIRTLSQAIREQRLVEIEYVAVGEETSVRVIEPHALERELPWWYVHSWDRTRDAQRSFRLDRMRRATLQKETFDPRPAWSRASCGTSAWPRCSSTPRSRAGASSAARSRWRRATRSRRSASAAPTGSSARSSPTAASPRCSSRRTSAPRSPRGRRSSSPRWPSGPRGRAADGERSPGTPRPSRRGFKGTGGRRALRDLLRGGSSLRHL